MDSVGNEPMSPPVITVFPVLVIPEYARSSKFAATPNSVATGEDPDPPLRPALYGVRARFIHGANQSEDFLHAEGFS